MAETVNMTAWAMIVAVTILGIVLAMRTVGMNAVLTDEEKLEMPRAHAIVIERRWTPTVVLLMASITLLTNVAVYLLVIGVN